MIKLKVNDFLKIKDTKAGIIYFSFVDEINNTDDSKSYRYLTHLGIAYGDDFMDDEYLFKIIAVWRYDETTENFVKLYDKEKPCKTVEPNIDEEKPFHPLERGSGMEAPCEPDVPSKIDYDKYVDLEHENEELKNIIVELNKKIYRKDYGE